MTRFNIISAGKAALHHYGWLELKSGGGKTIEVVMLNKGGSILAGRNKMLFADLLKTINKYYTLDAVPEARNSGFRHIYRIRRTKKEAKGI